MSGERVFFIVLFAVFIALASLLPKHAGLFTIGAGLMLWNAISARHRPPSPPPVDEDNL